MFHKYWVGGGALPTLLTSRGGLSCPLLHLQWLSLSRTFLCLIWSCLRSNIPNLYLNRVSEVQLLTGCFGTHFSMKTAFKIKGQMQAKVAGVLQVLVSEVGRVESAWVLRVSVERKFPDKVSPDFYSLSNAVLRKKRMVPHWATLGLWMEFSPGGRSTGRREASALEEQ